MPFPFAGLWFDNLQSLNGGPLPGLQVTVTLYGTLTLATLYTDRTRAGTVPNPTSTDSRSNLGFYADPGLYDLYTPGSSSVPAMTVAVVPDASDLAGAVTSVFGRTGAVTAQSGDYTPAQVGVDITRLVAAPSAQGFKAWNYDPVMVSGGSNLVSGTLAIYRVPLLSQQTISAITFYAQNAGSGLTAAQSLLGLYDSAGVQRGVSADQSASWTSSGVKTVALVTPYVNAPVGDYLVAQLCNGTTPVGPGRTNSSGAIAANAGLTPANFRFGIGGTGATVLPASLTPSAFTQGSGAIGAWCALS